MTRAEAFERWIRTSFVEMNTELENLYFAQDNRSDVIGGGGSIKAALRDEGRCPCPRCSPRATPATDSTAPSACSAASACTSRRLRRHELTNPAREERSPFPEASSLALHLGASLGHGAAILDGASGDAQPGAGRRAQELHIAPRRISVHRREHARDLVAAARGGCARPDRSSRRLESGGRRDVRGSEARAARRHPVQRPADGASSMSTGSSTPCGRTTSPIASDARSIAAPTPGDFSGINEIDLLLGLCRANDPYYAQLLVDKMLFMIPGDQARLRDCMTRTSLLDELLELDRRTRGQRLVPAQCGAPTSRSAICSANPRPNITTAWSSASSRRLPPNSTREDSRASPRAARRCRCCCARSRYLRDLRLAADRTDIASRHADLGRLRRAVRG